MTVPASILVSSGLCVGVSACVSPGLAFDVTFVVSLIFLVRALIPDLVDGAFALVDDCVQHRAHLARAAIGKRARILRDVVRRHHVVTLIYALAVERVRSASAIVADEVGWMKTAAIAKWGGFKDRAFAVFFWLRLIAGVINLAATVLFNIAFEEDKRRAPSVLGWRCVNWIRSPPNEEEAACRGSKPDTSWLLVWISVIIMYCTQVLVLESLCSGMTTFTSFFGCFAALCGFALMEAERVYYHWDSNHVANTDSSTANQGRRVVGNAAGGTAEFSLRLAWESLWFLIILTYFSDACFLYIVLGKRPLVLASLAIFELTALTLARQIYLTTDDGEEATGSGDGAQGETNKWHRAAMVVLAIESAKVFTTYLFIDFFLGAVCFASLCAMAAFLFDEAICLPDVHPPGKDENQDDDVLAMDLAGETEDSDNVHNRESAGIARDIPRNADDVLHKRECAALAMDIPGDDEGSSDVHAEDPSAAAACDYEKEGSTTDEQSSDASDSEGEVEEHSHEEPGYSSSSSMDDWSHVGVDPTMPTDVNGGAGRKFSFFSMRVRG